MVDGRWRITDKIEPICDGPYTLKFMQVDGQPKALENGWTHFGFFNTGPLEIVSESQGQVQLPHGGFFRIPGQAKVYGREGFVISLKGDHGFFQCGGPFATMRKVRYPPGGEQNCLIWPAGMHMASMNYLTLTKDMGWQDRHRHPSLRLNIVLKGDAKCYSEISGVTRITAGDVILLKTQEEHAFGDAISPMTFVAFHPDSAPEVFTHGPMPAQTVLSHKKQP